MTVDPQDGRSPIGPVADPGTNSTPMDRADSRFFGRWHAFGKTIFSLIRNPKNIAGILIAIVSLIILIRTSDFSPIKIWRSVQGTKGYIFVDSPEVYTRERLINERLKEDAWLNEQFKLADSDSSIINLLNVIEKRRNVEMQPQSVAKAEQPIKIEAPEAQESAQNSRDPNSNLTFDSSRMLTSVDSLTFSEQVSLKSANRDFILQKLIENRLDDRHDLQGNSLYIFKFDTTVVTSEFSEKKAMVEVELVPPIAGDVSADKDTFLISALEDQFSATLLRDAFDQFISDTYDRINRALKKSPSAIDIALASIGNDSPSAPIDLKELAQNWARSIAQEFGLDESGISLQATELANQTTIPENERQYQLNLRIDAFSQFFSFETIAKKSDLRNVAPAFSLLELTQSFMLLPEECEDLSDKSKSAPFPINKQIGKQFVLSEIDQTYRDELKPLSVKLSTLPVAQLNYYTKLNGYELLEHSRAFNFLRLLSSKVGSLPLDFGQASAPWGYVTRSQMKKADDSLVPNCYALTGYLGTGFMAFAQKVANHNSYSYSVLPRQSAVSVVEQILESNEARLTTRGLTALNFGGSLSADNDTNVTTSSLRSRVSAFGYALQSKGMQSDNVIVGWIIDPSASKPYSSSDNLYTVTESVLAIVSVPAWWPYVNLNIRKRWLSSNGSTEPEVEDSQPAPANANSQNKVPPNSVSSHSCTMQKESNGRNLCQLLRVSLPNSREIIESSIISADKRFPSISNAYCETTGSDEKNHTVVTCIIMGKRLWRNTVVTLGVVEHSTLKILPNMEGIMATFHVDGMKCEKSISVWTSEGVATHGTDEKEGQKLC